MDEKRLRRNAQIVLGTSCRAKPGESVVIMSDQNENRVKHCRTLASVAREMGLIPMVIDISEYNGMVSGKELNETPSCGPAKAAIEKADITLRVGGPGFKHLLSDPTGDEMALTGQDRRFYLLSHGLENWDINAEEVALIRLRTLWLCKLLKQSKEVHVTSSAGTDFKCGLGPTANWLPILQFVPLYGEVALVPQAGSSNGIYVIDGPTQMGVRTIDELDTEPLAVEVENGKIVNVKGVQEQIDRLNALVEGADPRADFIDEIGVVTTNMPENDGFWGDGTHQHDQIHIALGNNLQRENMVHGACHMDGDLIKPDVSVDGLVIVKDGVFLDDVLGKA